MNKTSTKHECNKELSLPLAVMDEEFRKPPFTRSKEISAHLNIFCINMVYSVDAWCIFYRF